MEAHPFGTHFYLRFTFFTGYVQHLGGFQHQSNLEHLGGFANTRFSANQGQRSRNNSTSTHPVRLLALRDQPRILVFADILKLLRNGCPSGFFRALLPISPSSALLLKYLLYIGVPFSTRWAFTNPFGAFRTTILTEVACSYFGHNQCASSQSLPIPTSTSRGTSMVTALAISRGISRLSKSISSTWASKTNSSWTWSSILDFSLADCIQLWTSIMAALIMSAALPWIGALMAFRSAKPRMVAFLLLISLKYRRLPNTVSTYSYLWAFWML